MSEKFPNVNALWSTLLVETLFRKGVRQAVICPGSRSSPLTFAFAEHQSIESISVLDERSASFFALGLAKRTGVPPVLVCTSGTAAANFFPAVIEASENGIPLIVITADRPPELRNCVAGQTIDQVKLYGKYPRISYELALPEASEPLLRYLRQTVIQAYDRSLGPETGPVHLNAPFRDPLPPIEQEGFESQFHQNSLKSLLSDVGQYAPQPFEASVDLMEFSKCERGLLLVGPVPTLCTEDWISNVASFAKRLNWPVLSDGLNPLRNYNDWFPNLITNYVSILRFAKNADWFRPERLIVLGELPTSKFLREWIEQIEPRMLILSNRFRDADPTRSRSNNMYFDFHYASPNCHENQSSEYLDYWFEHESSANQKRDTLMSECDSLFEGKVAWELSQSIPDNTSLFVSNSMPPRDIDFFWKASHKAVQVYSSRGASGIDGILSTASGVAHRGDPTILLTGDLALLHDSNGGLLSRRIEGSLTIVLISNNGGGIFEMLPVSQFGETFETYFGTPQDVDFKKWCALYSIEYKKIDSWQNFRDELSAMPAEGVRLLEITTDRKADAQLRKNWLREIGSGWVT